MPVVSGISSVQTFHQFQQGGIVTLGVQNLNADDFTPCNGGTVSYTIGTELIVPGATDAFYPVTVNETGLLNITFTYCTVFECITIDDTKVVRVLL